MYNSKRGEKFIKVYCMWKVLYTISCNWRKLVSRLKWRSKMQVWCSWPTVVSIVIRLEGYNNKNKHIQRENKVKTKLELFIKWLISLKSTTNTNIWLLWLHNWYWRPAFNIEVKYICECISLYAFFIFFYYVILFHNCIIYIYLKKKYSFVL